jgi:tetratricopeptide (TPR) repeat protein
MANNGKLLNLLKNVEKYTILVTLFLYPLIILTNFINLFETSKLLLLLVSLIILLISKAIRLLLLKKIEYNSSNFDIFALIFGLAFVLSGVFSIVNKIDAFFLPGSASFVTIGVLLYFFINQHDNKFKDQVELTLISSGVLFTLFHILSAIGLTKLISFLPEVFKLEFFTNFGNLLSSIIFLIAIIPLTVYRLLKTNDMATKILLGLVSIIIVIGLVSLSNQTFVKNKNDLQILKLKYGWSIAIDSLKVNPLFGVGPTNFNFAFNKFKPIEFNLEKDWTTKYLQNTNYALNVITETGILGLIALITLLVLLIKNRDLINFRYLAFLIYITGIFLLPVSPSILVVMFVTISLTSKIKNRDLAYFSSKIPQFAVFLLIIILTLSISYFGVRAFYAEYLFSKSINATQKNNTVESYDLVNKAIKTNQYSDKYHLFSASLNLAIANALAENKDLKDEDKQKISQLIQQAIKENKASVSVARYKSSNWEALSETYRSIIAFAQGADIFALESINQAIVLNPVDPNLRLKLGGLYYSLKQYDKAIDAFKLAVLAKPDLANSHYNLGMAYKENNDLEKAKEQINIVLELLGKDSKDYDTALKELEKIEELSKPEEKPEPIIEPQIELPQEVVEEPQI